MIAQLYTLYRPYFGLSQKNLTRTLGIFSIIVFSVITSFSMITLHNAFAALQSTLLMPEVTFSLIGISALECLLPLALWGGLFQISLSLTSWLSSSLNFELQQDLVKKYTHSRFYVGIKFIDEKNKKNKKINSSVILGNDLSQICTTSLLLFTTLIQAFLNFATGGHQLIVMSYPITITVFSVSFAVPGYMFIFACFYALIYSQFVNFLAQKLAKIESKLRQTKDKVSSLLQHIEEHPESIALKNGTKREKTALLKSINKSHAAEIAKMKINFPIEFFKAISMNVSFLFGLFLSAPGIVAKKLESAHAFSLGSYFSSVVSFFTWKKDNIESITTLDVSLKRFNVFHDLMKEWDEISQKSNISITLKKNRFAFQKLSVKTPSGEPILDNASIELPIGKAIVLQGSSGVGKTTLFRCLAGLWPYVKGEFILPKNGRSQAIKTYYIPQKTYFPYRGTLLEAICYPDKKATTVTQRNHIIRLMRDLELEPHIINALDKKDKWEEKLSGGQQQRIAAIGAILKKPDLLFIDEGTNAIDLKTKHLVQDALKRHLRTSTIVAIDHHSEPDFKPFYDAKLKMKKNENKPGATLQLQHLQPTRRSQRLQQLRRVS